MSHSVSIYINEKSHDEPHDETQDKSRNGKDKPPINMLEISPNGKYLVTYSEENKTIVGWNVNYVKVKKDDDTKEGEDKLVKITKENTVTVIEENEDKVVNTITDIEESEDKSVKVTKHKTVNVIEGSEDKPVEVLKHNTIKVGDKNIRHMCVSDKKILAYIYNDYIGKYKKCNYYYIFFLFIIVK